MVFYEDSCGEGEPSDVPVHQKGAIAPHYYLINYCAEGAALKPCQLTLISSISVSKST